jgi:phospholipase/carboxylesterase
VFLHGTGSSGEDIAQCFNKRTRAKLPHVSWLFPTASLRPYTLFGGEELPVWFDRTSLGLSCREDRAGIAHSIAGVRALVAKHAAGLPSSRIVMAGFSQGGALALYAAFADDNAQPFAGCVASSGFLPDPTFLLDEAKEKEGVADAKDGSNNGGGSAFPAALRSTPLLLVHGTRDQVVPYSSGTSTFDRLRARSGLVHVEHFRREGMEHEVDQPTLQRLMAFFAQCLPASAETQ